MRHNLAQIFGHQLIFPQPCGGAQAESLALPRPKNFSEVIQATSFGIRKGAVSTVRKATVTGWVHIPSTSTHSNNFRNHKTLYNYIFPNLSILVRWEVDVDRDCSKVAGKTESNWPDLKPLILIQQKKHAAKISCSPSQLWTRGVQRVGMPAQVGARLVGAFTGGRPGLRAAEKWQHAAANVMPCEGKTAWSIMVMSAVVCFG